MGEWGWFPWDIQLIRPNQPDSHAAHIINNAPGPRELARARYARWTEEIGWEPSASIHYAFDGMTDLDDELTRRLRHYCPRYDDLLLMPHLWHPSPGSGKQFRVAELSVPLAALLHAWNEKYGLTLVEIFPVADRLSKHGLGPILEPDWAAKLVRWLELPPSIRQFCVEFTQLRFSRPAIAPEAAAIYFALRTKAYGLDHDEANSTMETWGLPVDFYRKVPHEPLTNGEEAILGGLAPWARGMIVTDYTVADVVQKSRRSADEVHTCMAKFGFEYKPDTPA